MTAIHSDSRTTGWLERDRRVLAATLCLLAAGTACAESNPLLGRWKLVSGERGCNQAMHFEAAKQSMTSRGNTSGAPVSGYVVEKSRVIVGGTPGVIGTFSYDFKDGDTIHQPQMSGACVWKRA